MSTIVVDLDTIRDMIREAVRDVIAAELPALVENAVRKPWLTKIEIQEWTGWSDRTLQHLRDTRQIPFTQHGRKILYPTRGIEAFLKAHRVSRGMKG